MGFEVYYGDATRMDLLESAGIEEAEMLICAIDDPETTKEIVGRLQEKYPKLKLMVRAKSRYDAYELLNMGVKNVYRESLETSVRLASEVLHQLGFRKYTVLRQAQNFIKYDEESLRRLANEPRKGSDQYAFKVRKEISLQEKLLEADLQRGIIEYDHEWNSEERRKEDEEVDDNRSVGD
jgi:CPA2 family monovalent cation:H+ antiporter-2/glutathione-regulated potassium-efflux system protein KefB